MLQLVQSPSQRVQRLISKNCLSDGNEQKSKSSRNDNDGDQDKATTVKATRGRASETGDANYDGTEDDDKAADDQKASESRTREVSSSVIRSSDEGEPSITRVNKSVDQDGNIFVSSSSSYTSNSSPDNEGDESGDDDQPAGEESDEDN